MSLGQTPLTMITKITKTAIALKTNSFDQKKNSKKFKEIYFIKEILCNFLVETLQYFQKSFKILALPMKS